MPWTIDLGASVAYERSFGTTTFRAKLAVFNLLDQQRPVWVYQDAESSLGSRDETFGHERFLQSPRYGQLTLSLDF
jgi:outer membrane receptor protein involved in Fe transport